jgi:hypothetical protein
MKPAVVAFAPVALFGVAVFAPAAVSAPERPSLGFPLACELGRTCEIQHYVDRDPGPGTRDYRCGLKTYDKHNGIDIRVPDMAAQRAGVAVLAAAAGTVSATRDGVADVSVRAAGAPSVANIECGNGVVIDHGGGWSTQYCHLAKGSIAVRKDQAVAAGAAIGKVGLSGNTEFPHLHVMVRHNGQVVDPFAPDMAAACGASQAPLWAPAVAAKMTYRPGAVLNAGFTSLQPTMEQVEAGGLPRVGPDAPVLIAYARGIALLPGDLVELELKGPDGALIAKSQRTPLVNWRAQDLVYVGRKRPATGWARGTYVADYRVIRQGKLALSRRFELRL